MAQRDQSSCSPCDLERWCWLRCDCGEAPKPGSVVVGGGRAGLDRHWLRSDGGEGRGGATHEVEAVADDDGEVERLNDAVGEVGDEADERGPRERRVPTPEIRRASMRERGGCRDGDRGGAAEVDATTTARVEGAARAEEGVGGGGRSAEENLGARTVGQLGGSGAMRGGESAIGRLRDSRAYRMVEIVGRQNKQGQPTP
jgi:hypothetical protein